MDHDAGVLVRQLFGRLVLQEAAGQRFCAGDVPGLELVRLPHVQDRHAFVRVEGFVDRFDVRLLRRGFGLGDQILVTLRHLRSSFSRPSVSGGMLAPAGDGYAFLFFVETVKVPSGRSPNT